MQSELIAETSSPLYSASAEDSTVSFKDDFSVNSKSPVFRVKGDDPYNEVLLDYTKTLREKYERLQNHCLKSDKKSKCDCDLDEKSSGVDPVTFQKLKTEKEEFAKKHKELEDKNKELKTKFEKAKNELEEKTRNIDKLKVELSKLKSENEESNSKSEELALNHETEINDLEERFSRKEKEAKECLDELEKSQNLVSKIPELKRQLLSLENNVLLRQSAEDILSPKKARNNSKPKKIKSENSRNSASKKKQEKTDFSDNIVSDVTVIEVTGSKVSLRAGPGTNHSSMMDVQKGTRLVMEAKKGNWYRVNAPTGGRAYISAKYVKELSGISASAGKNNFRAGEIGVDPVRPPLPQKPVRKISSRSNSQTGSAGVNSSGDSNDVEIPVGGNSSEEIAIEKLMQALNKNSQGSDEE